MKVLILLASSLLENRIDKLVFCSGKIYYELLDKRVQEQAKKVALVRIEQLFPLDIERINKLVDQYNPKEIIWAQEEPENMGAWTFILSQLRSLDIDVISRISSAATASGSSKRSAEKQKEIIDKVFK